MKKVYLDELENESQELVNYSKEIITSKINELKEDPNLFVWEGLAHETYIKEYENKINKIIEYNNGLCKLAEFLAIVSENYGSANKKIDNAYEEIMHEFGKLRGMAINNYKPIGSKVNSNHGITPEIQKQINKAIEEQKRLHGI